VATKRDPAELCGKTIAARYVLRTALGSGNMGCVFAADDLQAERRVAIKVLHEAKPRLMARFEREVQVMSAVSSPHIAESIAAGFDEAAQLPYHVMELLEGESLATVLARSPVLAPRVVLSIAAQACEGLAIAHAGGVVHRDIKPANIFLAADRQGTPIVKLLDFGLAKPTGQGFFGAVAPGSQLTKPRSIIGSPRYMSPEQARGTGTIDRRSDIWSLGVIMYEALSGSSPHGEATSVGDRILRICVKDPAPLADAAPALAPEVVAMVMRALRRERDERYASAAAMREELLDWLGGSCDLTPADLPP
jgi:serine/threonine-protein kinase